MSEQAGDFFDPDEPPGGVRKFWGRAKADTYRWPRLFIAIVVLLGFIGGLLGSRFHVCKDETITKGGETTVTHTCGAPGVSDAEVVAIALFIVLLLVPDMSEVGVFGVSLKRRLAAAEEKASESIAKAENLQHQLQVQSLRVDTLTQNAAAAAAKSQATGNITFIGREVLRDMTVELPEKVSAFERGVTPPKKRTDRRATATPDPELVTRLIANWEDISELLALPPPRSDKTEDVRFTSTFQEELEAVSAARNTVVRARPISFEDLHAAVEISDRLLLALRETRDRGAPGW